MVVTSNYHKLLYFLHIIIDIIIHMIAPHQTQ